MSSLDAAFLRITGVIRLVTIRAVAALIARSPWKAVTVRALGMLAGLAYLVVELYEWPGLIRSRRHIGIHTPAPLFLLKFFIRKGSDVVWQLGLYESYDELSRHFVVEGSELLETLRKTGKGALLLGGHYGPRVVTYLLTRRGFDVRAIVEPEVIRIWEDAQTSPACLMNRGYRFLHASGRTLRKGREEKTFVRHLKAGGIGLMLIDHPGPSSKAESCSFFGRPIPAHRFPFRLSESHGIPLFSCLIVKQAGGYSLRIATLHPFDTPGNGYRAFLARLEAQIRNDPFGWYFLPRLDGWEQHGK